MFEIFKGKVTPKDWAFNGAIVAGAAVLCAAFYFLVYTPQIQAIADREKELDEVRTELRKVKELAANIDELRDEAQKWQELVQLFEERLPDEREIPHLLQNFERLGDEIGLRLQLSQLPTITDQNKETIPYKVVCRGTFHEIVTFINVLERQQRYLRVSDLDIKEEQAGVSEATFTLSTFRFVQSDGRPEGVRP